MGKPRPVIFAAVLLISLVLASRKSTGIAVGSKKGGAPTSWPSSTPEKQGMDSAALVRLLDHVENQPGVDGLLVIRNGAIVLEAYYAPYTGNQKHILNSCTKSFVSALVGIAIDRGYLSGVSSKALDYFPRKLCPITRRLSPSSSGGWRKPLKPSPTLCCGWR